MIEHKPVLVREVMEVLNIQGSGTYLDATAGGGGHSKEILKRLSADGRLICTDRDDFSVDLLQRTIHDERVTVKKVKFSRIREELGSIGIGSLDGVLFDLGVSMFQLRDTERGFSFDSDAPLDMRMNRDGSVTAAHIVNRYPEKNLAAILWEYADERRSRRIAREIVAQRAKKRIETCRELAVIVEKVYGGRGKTHPATRTFQALRIAVNEELMELNEGLTQAFGLLKSGGRIGVISYHSKEDRIAKNFFRDKAREGELALLFKKPVVPMRDEIQDNPSARSAKLRGAVRS